jgi:hypothetical protein
MACEFANELLSLKCTLHNSATAVGLDDDDDALAAKVRKHIIAHCCYFVVSTGASSMLSHVVIVIAYFDHASGFDFSLLSKNGP